MRRTDRTSVQRGPVSAMRRLLPILLATSYLSPAQISAPGLQPDEQPTSIKGTVVNAITRAPIARALVFSPDNRFAALTDGEGNFSFALPKAGSNAGTGFNGGFLGLTARKPGFLNDPNDRRQAETSGSELTITIPLMPEALIKGRVISSETDPAPGINVQLFSRQVQDGMPRWVQMGSTRANSSGEFRFAELLPGTYKLMTNEWMDNDPATTIPGGQQYGFPPVYYPGVSDFAAAGTIQLTAGQTVQADVPLTRQPYYPVRIPVANPELRRRDEHHGLRAGTPRSRLFARLQRAKPAHRRTAAQWKLSGRGGHVRPEFCQRIGAACRCGRTVGGIEPHPHSK